MSPKIALRDKYCATTPSARPLVFRAMSRAASLQCNQTNILQKKEGGQLSRLAALSPLSFFHPLSLLSPHTPPPRVQSPFVSFASSW
jgi:hypothetical protein